MTDAKQPRAQDQHARGESASSLRDQLMARGFTASTTASPSSAPGAAFDLSRAAKIIVRREKKGRSGKVVTLITGMELARPGLEELAKQVRKALGCGAMIEGDAVVVQGDLGDRVQQWLTAHGAKRVVRGN